MVFLGLLGAGGAALVRRLPANRAVAVHVGLHHAGSAARGRDASRLADRPGSTLLPLLAAGLAVAAATLGVSPGHHAIRPEPQEAGARSLASQSAGQAEANCPARTCPRWCRPMIMLPVFLWAVYVVARDKLDVFLALPFQSVESGFAVSGRVADGRCSGKRPASSSCSARWICSASCSRYNAELRMSKQDIKDEMQGDRRQPADEGARSGASSATARASK